MKSTIIKHFKALNFTYQNHTEVSKGGQLSTFIVIGQNDKTAEVQTIVYKEINKKNNHSSKYGKTSLDLLRAEAKITSNLASGGFGPDLIRSTDDYVIRHFAHGETMYSRLLTSDHCQSTLLFSKTLTMIRNLLSFLEKKSTFHYLDANCKNLIINEKDKIILIDHEWGVNTYKTHEDQCIQVLFVCGLSFLTHSYLSFDEIVREIKDNEYFKKYAEHVISALAKNYFVLKDISIQQKMESSSIFIENINQSICRTSPIDSINALCAELKDKKIRYCFARHYNDLWISGIYKEKDIDLYIHPDDIPSCGIIMSRQGFVQTGPLGYLQYYGETEQVAFLDFDPVGYSNYHPCFNASSIVENAQERDGKLFLSDNDFFGQIIINSFRQKRDIKKSYKDFLIRHISSPAFDEAYIVEALCVFMNLKNAEVIIDNVKKEKWSAINPGVFKHTNSQKLAPINYKERIYNRLVKGPKLIAMLGVDGAGKSSTLKSAMAALEKAKLSTETHYLGCYYPPSGRGQSFVLPTDSVIMLASKMLVFIRQFKFGGKIYKSGKPFEQKANDKPFSYSKEIDDKEWIAPLATGGKHANLIFRTYAWLLYLDCFLMGIRLRSRWYSNIIFTDRYFYDLVTYIGRKSIISKLIARSAMPDAAIFLHAKPKTQAHREPRHPVSEIRANQHLYRMVPIWNPKVQWYEVSTELPPEVVVQKVLYIIMTTSRVPSITKPVGQLVCRATNLIGRVITIFKRKS